MDDLIHRQAAINVLEERLQANGYSSVVLVSELNRSIGYLKQLPSAERRGRWLETDTYPKCSVPNFIKMVEEQEAADVIEVNAFRNEVYQYIAANKDEDANFLSGLETAVVIAEKMAGVYEEVEE